jgi:hypothetical protein
MHFSLLVLLAPHQVTLVYLDPGSGSFIIQVLIAGLVGAGFLIKVYWKKIKGFFSSFASKKEDD